MSRSKTHKDVEYAVDDASGEERIFKSVDAASAFAISVAIATGYSTIDVLVYSEDGAAWYGGDDAFDRYNDDPEASVFERLEIRVNVVGSVP
jgi:hypothetical protein